MLLRTFNYFSANVKKHCLPLIVVVCKLAICGASTLCGNKGKCMLHIIMLPGDYHKFCSASGMFVENGIDNSDARIRRLVYGSYQLLMCSGKSLISGAMNNSAWLPSDLYRNWKKVSLCFRNGLETCFLYFSFSLLSFDLSYLKLHFVSKCLHILLIQTAFVFVIFIVYI